MKDADKDLPRRQAAQHIGAQGPLPHDLDEVAHHGQGNVCFDQGAPHIPDRVLDIFLGEPAPAADLLEYATQPVTESIEHADGYPIQAATTGRVANCKLMRPPRVPACGRRRGPP